MEYFLDNKVVKYQNENIKIVINLDQCLESYPCKHYVMINDEKKCMDSRDILALLTLNGFEIPDHFNYMIEDDLV